MADDLDDILNSALDELDEEEEEEEGTGVTLAGKAAAPPSTPPKASGPKSAAAAASEAKAAGEGGHGEEEEEEDGEELRAAIAKTLDMLGKLDANLGADGSSPGGGAGGAGGDNIFDEAFLNKLVEEFDKFGAAGGEGGAGAGAGGPGAAGDDSMVDSMVRQLLAKELMYPPLKEVTKQFPAWLEANRGKVEAAAFQRHEEQYALFQEIVAVYEAEDPGTGKVVDMGRLLDLMTRAQDYGQPPAEITMGLLGEAGAAGAAGPGGLPAGLGGLPLGPDGAPDPEACAIM